MKQTLPFFILLSCCSLPMVPSTNTVKALTTTFTNGGFETGDLTGWTATGEAFTSNGIRNATDPYWGNRNIHGVGQHLFNGFEVGENLTGTLISGTFTPTLEAPYVSFRIGGAMNVDAAYVAIKKATDDSVVIKTGNTRFSDPATAMTLTEFLYDLSAYENQPLYFEVVDHATAPFGAIVLDDFNVLLSEQQAKDRVALVKEEALNDPDSMSKDYLTQLYTKTLSYPIAGLAPIIQEIDGYAYQVEIEPTLTYNLTGLLSFLKITDDYTASKDIVKTITEVKKDGVVVAFESLQQAALSEGTYELSVQVADYRHTVMTKIKIVVSDTATYPNQVVNGNLETGDLSGWEVLNGKTILPSAISQDVSFWGEQIPFNKEGNYFFNGFPEKTGIGEMESYTLRSSRFTLAGSGWISFRLGGRNTRLHVYTADQTLIASYNNYTFRDVNFPNLDEGCRLATMTTYFGDLSSYIGETLYIEILDSDTQGAWGNIFFDAIQTYYETQPTLTSDIVPFYKKVEGVLATSPMDYPIAHQQAIDTLQVTTPLAQSSIEANPQGNYRVRFLGTIDSLDYDTVGFLIAVRNEQKTFTTTKVYETVNVTFGDDSTQVSASQFGGAYFFGLILSEVPVDTEFEVQTFGEKDGYRILSQSKRFYLAADGTMSRR